MRQVSFLSSLILCCSLSACGFMPASYDQIALDCGGLDRTDGAPISTIVQVASDGETYDPAKISAKWSANGVETQLKVSPKGCIATPQAAGALKLVSDNRSYGMSLTLPQDQSDLLLKTKLKPLIPADFRISCTGPSVLRRPTDLSLRFEWEALSESDFWQIDQLRYQIEQQGQPLAGSSLQLNESKTPTTSLTLGPLQLKDGTYVITAQAKTLAGDSMNSANFCTFELDQTPPVKSKLLESTVSSLESPLRFTLDSVSEAVFYCISSLGGSECESTNDFKLAAEYVSLPKGGPQTLHSFGCDRAGNCSEFSKEDFFADAAAPKLSVQWLNQQFQQGFDWAVEPNEVFGFRVSVEDDSNQAGFMTQGELTDNTQCRVSYVDPAGGRFTATQAICVEGRCEGLPMGSWVPCDGTIKFRFQLDSIRPLLQSNVQVEVRTQDRVGRTGVAVTDFWMNVDAFHPWRNATVALPSSAAQLSFINDSFGRFIAFTPSLDGSSPNSPAVLVRSPGQTQWSAPTPIQTQGLSLLPLEKQDMFLARSFQDEGSRDALWLTAGNQQATLVEVPLFDGKSSSLPQQIEARAFPIPKDILDKLKDADGLGDIVIQGLAEFRDTQGKRHLLILLNSLLYSDTRRFLFVSFDGARFSTIADSADLTNFVLRRAGPGLLQGPQGHILTILNDQLVSFDPIAGAFSYPSVTPTLKSGIHSLYKDRMGFYGLANASLQPFFLNFDASGSDARLQLMVANEKFKGPSRINHLVRKADGSFWLSAPTRSGPPVLLAWKPWVSSPTGWVQQDVLWDWSIPATPTKSFDLGIDQNLDQLAVTTLQSAGPNDSNRLLLRMMQNSHFIEVTDQGLLRTGTQNRPTQRVLLGQDSKQNLLRLSYWRSAEDGLLALSTLGTPTLANGISMKSLVGPSEIAMASALDWIDVDRNGAVWFEDKVDGVVKKLNAETSRFEPEFQVESSLGKWRYFDSQGNYWGSKGLAFTEILLRRPDQAPITIQLPEGVQGEKIIWNEPISWILARQSADDRNQLLELDLRTVRIKDDRSLAGDEAQIIDVIPFLDRRLALVRESDHSSRPANELANLKIYEDNGREWVAWSDEHQLKWPHWHPAAQQAVQINNKVAADATLFYEPGEPGVLWVSGGSQVQGGPLLARMPLDSKKWTIFHPHIENLNTPVKKFWMDARKRIVLQTATQIFYFNPANLPPSP